MIKQIQFTVHDNIRWMMFFEFFYQFLRIINEKWTGKTIDLEDNLHIYFILKNESIVDYHRCINFFCLCLNLIEDWLSFVD